MSAGSSDTDYLRAGRGAPVLLLTECDGSTEPALVAPLAERFRVIAPCDAAARAAAEDGFAAWLGGFLDGLGVPSVGVVADATLSAAALRFAAAEPRRVSCLVLLRDSGAYAPFEAVLPMLDVGGADAPAIAAFLASHARHA